MKKGKLVLMRHGQTDYNKTRRITGHADATLTKEGEEQGRASGVLVKDIRFDKAYSSTLSRAFNTAALALEASGTHSHLQNADGTWQIEARPEIIETDAGEFTGRNLDTDPELSVFTRTYGKPMPGGESDKDVVARVQKFFDEEILPRLARGENVMLVCHSGTMHAFDIVLGLMETPPDNENFVTKRIPNASPLVCEYEDGVLKNHYLMENPATTKAANENKPPVASKNKYKPEL